MLDEMYSDNLLPDSESLPGFDITLGIDSSKIPQVKKVKKDMDEQT